MPPTRRPLNVFTSTGTDPTTDALRWSTPSGRLENDIVVAAPDGLHYLVISLEHEDIVLLPTGWATGNHPIPGPGDMPRSGIRLRSGQLDRDDEDDEWGRRGLRAEKQTNDQGRPVGPPQRPA